MKTLIVLTIIFLVASCDNEKTNFDTLRKDAQVWVLDNDKMNNIDTTKIKFVANY
jgi:hypothetical protein